MTDSLINLDQGGEGAPIYDVAYQQGTEEFQEATFS